MDITPQSPFNIVIWRGKKLFIMSERHEMQVRRSKESAYTAVITFYAPSVSDQCALYERMFVGESPTDTEFAAMTSLASTSKELSLPIDDEWLHGKDDYTVESVRLGQTRAVVISPISSVPVLVQKSYDDPVE